MITNISTNIVVTGTNLIQTAIESALPGGDVISSAVRQAATLSNESLFVAFLLGFNWMLKKAPQVYNELIPVISAGASTLVYPALMGFSVRNFLIGFAIGCTAVGMHQIPRQLGSLKERFRTGDTELVKKTDTTPPTV